MSASPLLDVPLIGAMAAGPLGMSGLPRLWQKGLLKAAGALSTACAYPDQTERAILDSREIEFPAFDAFVQARPTYLQTESWVREHSIAAAPGECVDAALAARQNWSDLDALHRYVAQDAHRRDTALAPAVSPLLAGPAGLLHLPRLWAKATIDHIGLLPEGYNSGKGPLDEQLAAAIGFDLGAAIRYVRTSGPTYRAFENWVRGAAATLNFDTTRIWNERIVRGEKPEHVAAGERRLLGWAGSDERGGVLLNHLVDLHYFHIEILAG